MPYLVLDHAHKDDVVEVLGVVAYDNHIIVILIDFYNLYIAGVYCVIAASHHPVYFTEPLPQPSERL